MAIKLFNEVALDICEICADDNTIRQVLIIEEFIIQLEYFLDKA